MTHGRTGFFKAFKLSVDWNFPKEIILVPLTFDKHSGTL